MTVTNKDMKRAARQVFAASRAIVTPFYNRDVSKKDVADLFANRERLKGNVLLIAAPMGTGKTFFIDQVANTLGIAGRAKPLLVGEITEKDLKGDTEDTIFVDEGDIKTNWSDLVRGVRLLGEHVRENNQIGLLLGDYTLRNPDLAGLLPNPRHLLSFEPLDEKFLRGVLRQRLEEYLNVRMETQIVDDDLIRALIPEGTAFVNSFRAILTFLESLVRTLPGDTKPCRLTLDMARNFMTETFDPVLSTDRQGEFLNRFLDHLAQNHRGGLGLEHGFSNDQLMLLAKQAGFENWESFKDEVIKPFGEQGLLLGRGVPGLGPDGQFERWREPFYPSLQLILMSGT